MSEPANVKPRGWWIDPDYDGYYDDSDENLIASGFVRVIEKSYADQLERGLEELRCIECGHLRCDCTQQFKARAEKAEAENKRLLERYRHIELANKELTKNDHVTFGQLLEANKVLEAACVICSAAEGGFTYRPATEALARASGINGRWK